MRIPAFAWFRVGVVLVDPSETVGAAVSNPRAGATAVTLFAAVSAIGLAALPRQLAVLQRALGSTGDPEVDCYYQTMTAGLTRLIVADRLVPSATLLLSAVLVVLLGGPLLSLARDRTRALWSVALLGLAPLIAQQLGSLALTYMTSIPAHPTPGDAVSLPYRFHTGLLLAWTGEAVAPHWLELLEPRLNLISLWCVALWTLSLRALDGAGLRAWHLTVPLTSVAAAGVLTWMVGPIAYSMLLGSP